MGHFKKGAGTMLFGTSVMIITLLFVGYFINLLYLRQYKTMTQLAADSMSDSLAIYMQTGGETMEDAEKEKVKLQKLISKTSQIKIISTKIDKKRFDKSEIAVNIVTEPTPVFTGSTKKPKKAKFHASSTTSFSVSGIRNAPAALQWAKTNIGTTTYSMSNRAAGLNAQGKIIATDCSGFVWWCYRKMGLNKNVGMWCTDNMGDYFQVIDYSEAKPGDIIWATAGDRGKSYGHTRILEKKNADGSATFLECTSGSTNGVREKTFTQAELAADGYKYGHIRDVYMVKSNDDK